MRKALNGNPLVQVGAIGLLGVIVAFLMLTRLSGSSDQPEPTTTTPTASDSTAPATSGVAPVAEAGAPAPVDPAAGGTAPVPGAAAAPTGAFEAGPGLPKPVVDAYQHGDTVVLLLTRSGGIDDRELGRIVVKLRGTKDVAFFHAYARDVARYSRIAQGVDVDRVPALVVLAPKNAAAGGTPVASVSYGFRGYDSILQAVEDARYKGDTLQYYPQDN